MKVIPLRGNPALYTGNAYLLLGEWNCLDDVNTLVDTGTDGDWLLRELPKINTGVGKRAVDQVILTHNHFDHAAGLPAIIAAFAPRVYALAPGPGVTQQLRHGDRLRCGDAECEIIATPGHSDDSLSLYCPAARALFSGDITLPAAPEPGYPPAFIAALRQLATLPLEVIYPGHGQPLTDNLPARFRLP